VGNFVDRRLFQLDWIKGEVEGVGEFWDMVEKLR